MLDKFQYIINFLLESQKKRKLICKLSVRHLNSVIYFLNILKEENLIWGYFISSNLYFVYLKYFYNMPVIKYVKFYGYKTKIVSIKNKKLYYNIRTNRCSIFILLSHIGLITGKFAFLSGLGGILVCKIN